MQSKRNDDLQVVLEQYSQPSSPARLSIGDIIRSPRFHYGIRMTDEEAILVGWEDASYPEHHASSGYGTLAHDETRQDAAFLVSSLGFAENQGPDDTIPEFRLAQDIKCLRLTSDLVLTTDAEQICFSQFEPMSVAQPRDDEIELLGFATMPIWPAGTRSVHSGR